MAFNKSLDNVKRFCGIVTEEKENNAQSLYHFTTFENALNILQTNSLLVGKTGYLSFTRNEKLYLQPNIGITGIAVAFCVNKQKLNNSGFEFESYQYHNMDVQVENEDEERIVQQNIRNFLSYVERILVIKFYWPDNPIKYDRLQTRLNRFFHRDDVSFEEYVDKLKIYHKPVVVID